MFKKKVCFNIYCSKVPCKITFSTKQGVILTKTIISNNEKICVCTECANVILSANFGSETIYQIFSLNNNSCQKIFSSIVFNNSRLIKIANLFSLKDANYGFPVAYATLRFKQTLK